MTTAVVDIGNARIKWAVAAGQRLESIGHARHADAEDAALEAMADALPEGIRRVVVSNVAGDPIAARLAELTMRRFGFGPELVETSREALGVRCGYRDPQRLGVDRWVALLAAFQLARALEPAPRPLCVINAGTAMTLDAVDAAGQHLGGLILPGPRIAADALHRNTRRIGATDMADAPPAGLGLFGKSTDEAVGHAVLLGPAAAFDRAVGLLAAELAARPVVFAAGGDAPLLAKWLETPVRVRADLVLEGLALIAAATPDAGGMFHTSDIA